MPFTPTAMIGQEFFVDKHDNLYQVDYDGVIRFCSNVGKVRNVHQLMAAGKTEPDREVPESYEELHHETIWKDGAA